MLLAAQLYTVRELINNQSDDDVYQVLSTLKNKGYEGIQVSGIGDVDKIKMKQFKTISEALEFPIVATHLGLDFLEKNIEWVIDYHKQWQCKYVGIGSMPIELRSYEGARTFANRCNKVGKQLKDAGLQLIYHNHKFEFERFMGKTMMEWLMEWFDGEAMQFELDTYWVQAGGCDPIEWIYRLNGKMKVIHFKDFRIVKDEQQFAEVGYGNLNWDKILEACRMTGIEIAAVEQDGFTNNPIESLCMSFDYLSNYYSWND